MQTTGIRYAVRIEASLIAGTGLRLPDTVTWPGRDADTETARVVTAAGNGNLFVLCWWFDLKAPAYAEGCLVDPVLEISYVPEPVDIDLRDGGPPMPVMPARAEVRITGYDIRGHRDNRGGWPASVNDIRTWADMPTRPHDGFGGEDLSPPAAAAQYIAARYSSPPGGMIRAASPAAPSLAAAYSARWFGADNGGMMLTTTARQNGRSAWLNALHAEITELIRDGTYPVRPARPAPPPADGKATRGKRKRRRRPASDDGHNGWLTVDELKRFL